MAADSQGNDVLLPRLSDSMERGTIVKWLKRDGETVLYGEDLVEIETDKATVLQTAEASGTLNILVEEGTSCEVGTVIAHLGGVVESTQTTTTSGSSYPSPQLPRDDDASSTSNAIEPDQVAVVDKVVAAGPSITPLARRSA